MLSVARWLLLFEGSWGIVQGIASFARRGTFDGATGDAVAGTIRPFAVTPDFSNPMFAVNVVFLLILLFPSLIAQRKGILAFGFGSLSLILASVLHVLLFLTVAVVIGFAFYAPRFFLHKRGCVTLIAAAGLGVLAVNLLSSNFGTLGIFARYTLEGRTIRAQVVTDAFTEIPREYIWQPFIGFGPGQFSSRASLIGTGLYFGSPEDPRIIPFLPQEMSQPFRETILDLWLSTPRDGINNSSTSKPYFSWLSVYSEWGMLGVIVFMIGGVGVLFRLRRLCRLSASPYNRLVAWSLATSVMFLFLLGVQENYWEVPQAILVGILLMKVQYANLANG